MNDRYNSSSSAVRFVSGFLACIITATLLIGVAVGLTGEATTLLAQGGDGNGGIARVAVRAA